MAIGSRPRKFPGRAFADSPRCNRRYDQELLTPVTSQAVVRTNQIAHPRRFLTQNFVTRKKSVPIVDELEVIYITQTANHTASATLEPRSARSAITHCATGPAFRRDSTRSSVRRDLPCNASSRASTSLSSSSSTRRPVCSHARSSAGSQASSGSRLRLLPGPLTTSSLDCLEVSRRM